MLALALPSSVHAACSEEPYYQIYPSHIVHRGQCASKEAALAACTELATKHGYFGTWCSALTTAHSGPGAYGGWFQEQKDRVKVPFHYSQYLYSDQMKSYKNQGAPPCEDQCFGDPINAGTGNKFEAHTEYRGPGPMPLEISWLYNSKFESGYYQPAALIFGRNRTHYYGRSVLRIETPSAPIAWVARPDGNALKFAWQSSAWAGDEGRDEVLRERFIDGAPAGWELRDASGGLEVFDLSGKLIELRDREGRVQRLAYSSAGYLQSVEDESGRQLRFEYATTGLVSRALLPDGGQILFRYSSGKDLTEVEYVGGAKLGYRYNETGLSSTYTQPGALTGVIDENGARYSSTKYDGDTRALRTEMGGGVADVVTATYTKPAYGAHASAAAITLQDGSLRNVSMMVVDGQVVPSAATTSCAGCPTRMVQYSYDQHGRPDVVTVNGVASDSDYNARGLLIQQVEAANR